MDTNNETIISGVCPHTNCTTQKFYTKEDYDKLQAENDNLKDDIDKQQLYVDSLEQENERLKEEIKEVKKYQYEQEYLEKEIETVKVNLDIGKEEARHYLHEAYKFQKCLQEIRDMADEYAKKYLLTQSAVHFFNTLENKINSVIGAE